MKLYRYGIETEYNSIWNIKSVKEYEFKNIEESVDRKYYRSENGLNYFFKQDINNGVHSFSGVDADGDDYTFFCIMQTYEDDEIIDKEILKKQVVNYYHNKLKEIIGFCNKTIENNV